MKVLVIDNYDSFTYNLVQYVKEFATGDVTVRRNDCIGLSEVANYDKILISPGSGLPKNAGISMDIIREYGNTKSILGICLGMQAIVEVYGGQLVNLEKVFHGISGLMIIRSTDQFFKGINDSAKVGRYHSWAMKDENVEALEVLARTEDDCIMAVRHHQYDVLGVQFHPESILTPTGKKMIENWMHRSPIKSKAFAE